MRTLLTLLGGLGSLILTCGIVVAAATTHAHVSTFQAVSVAVIAAALTGAVVELRRSLR